MGLPNRALEPISRSWSFCANDIELDPAQDPVQATIPSELRGRQSRKGEAEATILSGLRNWATTLGLRLG